MIALFIAEGTFGSFPSGGRYQRAIPTASGGTDTSDPKSCWPRHPDCLGQGSGRCRLLRVSLVSSPSVDGMLGDLRQVL